jgi:RHS repeat-associated protein
LIEERGARPSVRTAGQVRQVKSALGTPDEANEVTATYRNRAGETIGFTFDALDRLTLKDLPGSEPDVTYSYDLAGRMTGASQTGNALSFTYDALGRNLTQSGPHGTISSAFDLVGRRLRITHPDGFYVAQDYLVTGEMKSIRENGAASGVGVLATFAYDDLGRRTSLTRGNGTSMSYSYDAVSRLASLADNPAGTTHDQTLGFGYNPASQIVSNTRSNDLFSWAGNSVGTTASTANGLNQITVHGGTATSHDSRGNMTADGLGKTFGYSSENLLTSASGGVTLNYDPALRLYQVAGATTTRFAYDGADVIAEYNSSNALQRRYVHGPGTDEPLVWYEGAGTTDRRFLHADERGSIVAVSNGSGAVTNVNTYDEYGKPASTNVGRFQYTGQRWIGEIGLYDYKARMYDQRLGRFLQTDPIRFAGGMNMYGYVGGDPVNSSDPSGLCKDANGKYISAPTGTRICGGNSSAGLYGGIADHLSGSSTAGPGGAGGPTFGEAYAAAKNLVGAYGSGAVNSVADYLMGRGSLAVVATHLPVSHSEAYANFQLASSTSNFDEYVPYARLPSGSQRILKDRYVLPGGKVVVVVDTRVYEMRPADNGRGIVFDYPGPDRSSLRVMFPTDRYPTGYIRYMNSYGNYISPYSGRSGTDDQTHYPQRGSFPIPGR